jgi:spore coat protein SA
MTSYLNKPKVVIVAPDVLPVPPIRGGGIENGIWEILPHFSQYEIHILSVYNPELDNLKPFEKIGNNFIYRIFQSDKEKALLRVKHLSFNHHFPYAYKTAKLINTINPEIVHIRSRLWLLPYYRKYLDCHPKIILHHHNHYFCNMKKSHIKKILDKIDSFVGVSDYTVKHEVLNRLPEYRNICCSIHNGIDTNRFLPAPLEKDKDLLTKIGLSEKDTIFAFVGRITPSKGVHTILKAMHNIVTLHPEVKLMIIGSAWFGENTRDAYMQSLIQLAEPIKNNIFFTGFINRNEIIKYYHIADYYIGPSIFQDPSPNTCYESSAMEIPIIASNRGGIPEIVENGKTGVLVNDPENSDELTSTIEFFLSESKKVKLMGKNARKKMISNFTWKHAAIKTEQLYERLLSQS